VDLDAGISPHLNHLTVVLNNICHCVKSSMMDIVQLANRYAVTVQD